MHTHRRSTIVLLASLAASAQGCSLRAIANDPLPPLARDYVTRRFTIAELRAELASVVAIVEETEATPYMFRSRREITERLRGLQDQITHPMTRYEFLPTLLELRGAFEIAHGTVPFPIEEFNDFVARGGRLPSFAAGRVGNEITITRVEPTIRILGVGDELLSINGHDARALVDRIRAAIPDDRNPAYGDDALQRKFGQWLWAFGVVGPFHLKLRRGEMTYEIVEAGVRPERMLTIKERFLSRERPEPDAPPFSLRMLPGRVAVLDVRSFNPIDRERWDGFLEATFARLQREHVRGLVIDIRENGGGDTRAGDALLRYITDRPYRNFAGKLWRRSERYDAFFRAAIPWWLRWLPYERWVLGNATGTPHGQSRWFAAEPTTPTPTNLRFRGRVAVVTGPRTFSSAAAFADAVRTYRLATLVGEPPGGVNGVAGEIALTRLPKTKLAIAICSARFVRASGDERDLTPTQVDVAVAHGPGDPQLARAVEIVSRAPLRLPRTPPAPLAPLAP